MFASSELSRNQTLSNFVRKSNIILTCQEIKHHPNLSQWIDMFATFYLPNLYSNSIWYLTTSLTTLRGDDNRTSLVKSGLSHGKKLDLAMVINSRLLVILPRAHRSWRAYMSWGVLHPRLDACTCTSWSPFESIGDVRSKPHWRLPAPLYCYEKNCCPHPIAPSFSQTRANKYHGHADNIMAHKRGQGERASETATRDQSMKQVYHHGPASRLV